MLRFIRSATASVLFFLFLPSLAAAQCADGDEVCLQSADQADNNTDAVEQSVTANNELTTETFTDEQAALVAQITRNLKRRRLTRPAGDNALQQIQRLQAIHPQHDYAVNGTNYIARILIVLGRRALRNGDPVLAGRHLQKAIEFNPQVKRWAELRDDIARATGAATGTAATSTAAESQDAGSQVAADEKSADESIASDSNSPADPVEVVEKLDEVDTFKGKVTTDTYTQEQAELAAGITSDLKRRRLLEPSGNNALAKIQRLKEVHPGHDYSVNGEKYIARILMVLGRRAFRAGDLDLASRHMLKAIQFDPKVKRQNELQTAIAEAARQREAERVTERQIKALTEPTTSVTTYLQSDGSEAVQSDDVEFIAPVMVAIPAGNFLMGSDNGSADEKPIHHVVLEAFSMSKHEITVQQYSVFALATGRPAPQYLPEEGNLPVTNVSWHDAIAYTEWLSQRTERLFRLPTESEWEYAARAGTTSAYFTGDTLVNAANCIGCGGQWDSKSVAPVGSFEPNEFGLFDTHGNVWEWVQDCWTDNYANRNKSAAAIEIEGCERHLLRGGSWYNDADFARVSYRGAETASFRNGGIGFRVVHEGL